MMEKGKLFLGILIMILSINLVFAATSWCTDRDATESSGSHNRGINYYKDSFNSGANSQGSWSGKHDECYGNDLYEVYCKYDSSTGEYSLDKKVFDCGVSGCDDVKKICKTSIGQMTGLATLDSSTSYIGIGLIVVLAIVLAWFFLRKKKKK